MILIIISPRVCSVSVSSVFGSRHMAKEFFSYNTAYVGYRTVRSRAFRYLCSPPGRDGPMPHAKNNRLLSLMPPHVLTRFVNDLSTADLMQGQVLAEAH